MKKIVVIVISLMIIGIGSLAGCNTKTDNQPSDFTVSIDWIGFNLINPPSISIEFIVNINNWTGGWYQIQRLTYIMKGNYHNFSSGEISTQSSGSKIIQSPIAYCEGKIYLTGLTINPELNNTFNNKQPVTWDVSGELTLVSNQTGNTINIQFKDLTYNMTSYG